MDREDLETVPFPWKLLAEIEKVLENHEEGQGHALQIRAFLDDCHLHKRSPDRWRKCEHGVEFPVWDDDSGQEERKGERR